MIPAWLTPQLRQYLYVVATSGLGLLVVLKVIEPELVPTVLNFAAALLGLAGTATAALAVRSQRADGTLPSGRHAKPE